jgi:FlaA1/EpsC-like NDP-sugar epimerase
MNKNELIYFTHTQEFYRFIILKKIDENKSVSLPIESNDNVFLEAISKVHIKNLLEESLIISEKGSLKLTQDGLSILNKHYIDYQISLINISKNLGEFYSNKIDWLKKEIIGSVALYGASDTSKSFFNFIKDAEIKLECVIDDDIKKQNNRYLGLPVVSVKEIETFSIQTIIISSVQFQKEIKEKAIKKIDGKYKIINLFN